MATATPLDLIDGATETCRLYEVLRRDREEHGPARGPRAEPDRSVWRLLCFAGPAPLTDAQLQGALPSFDLEDLAAARARVAAEVRAEERRAEADGALDLAEMVDEPKVTLTEALAAGLDVHAGNGWAGLTLATPEERRAYFGDECAPSCPKGR
jgi:hypothetical protein